MGGWGGGLHHPKQKAQDFYGFLHTFPIFFPFEPLEIEGRVVFFELPLTGLLQLHCAPLVDNF
jgi:hypothetical protein